MKKKLICAFLAVMLLLSSVPAFAAGNTENATYESAVFQNYLSFLENDSHDSLNSGEFYAYELFYDDLSAGKVSGALVGLSQKLLSTEPDAALYGSQLLALMMIQEGAFGASLSALADFDAASGGAAAIAARSCSAFLDFVENERDNAPLLSGAASVRKVLNLAEEFSAGQAEGTPLFSPEAFEAIKGSDDYKNDEAVKALADFGSGFAADAAASSAALTLDSLSADMAGSAGVFERLGQIEALSEISGVLEQSVASITAAEGEEDAADAICLYASLCQMLAVARMRGEYCFRSLVSEGALSPLKNLYFPGGDDAEESFFSGELEFLQGAFKSLSSMLCAEDYYSYIENTLIPELGLANMDEQRLAAGASGYQALLPSAGATGLISALVYDFDGDGSDDLLAVVGAMKPMGETSLGRLMFDENSDCYALELRLYNTAGGSIALADSVSAVTEMEQISFGPMLIGVQESGGTAYIFSRCSMEDEMTYGPSPFEAYHVENGRFVYDYMGGSISWGQSSFSANIQDFLDTAMASTSDSGLNNPLALTSSLSSSGSNASVLEALSGRLITYINISSSISSEETVFSPADYTGLRAVLDGEEEPAAFAPEKIEAGDMPDLSGKGADISAMVSALEDIAGTLEQTSASVYPGGKYSAKYSAASGNWVSFNVDTSTGRFVQIIVGSSSGSANDEWTAMYNAILSAQPLGLSSADVSTLSGCAPSPGQSASAGGVTISFGKVSTLNCLINFPA